MKNSKLEKDATFRAMTQIEIINGNYGAKPRISTSDCLLSTNREIRCSFCHKSHSSSKCNNVTNAQARSNILKREGSCFLCLQSGHINRMDQNLKNTIGQNFGT